MDVWEQWENANHLQETRLGKRGHLRKTLTGPTSLFHAFIYDVEHLPVNVYKKNHLSSFQYGLQNLQK